MGIFGLFKRSKGSSDKCCICGKKFRVIPDGVQFPSEWTRDVAELMCNNCGARICHGCEMSRLNRSCPTCGRDSMRTLADIM